jgi:hypothetical protein
MDQTTEKTGEAQVASSAASAATCPDVVIMCTSCPRNPKSESPKSPWLTTLDGDEGPPCLMDKCRPGWDKCSYKVQVISARTSRPRMCQDRTNQLTRKINQLKRRYPVGVPLTSPTTWIEEDDYAPPIIVKPSQTECM